MGRDKADHLPELRLKLLILGQFEGPREMRLNVVGGPQALHAGLRDPGRARHRSAAPACLHRRRGHGFFQNHAHRFRRQGRFASAAGRIVQASKTPGEKALAPIVHRYPRHAQPDGDLCLRHASRPQQDHLSPLAVPHRDRGCPRAALQLPTFAGVQRNLAANHKTSPAAPQLGCHHHHCLSSYLRGTTLASAATMRVPNFSFR